MKKSYYLLILISALFLTSCGNDKPQPDLASDIVGTYWGPMITADIKKVNNVKINMVISEFRSITDSTSTYFTELDVVKNGATYTLKTSLMEAATIEGKTLKFNDKNLVK